MIKLSGKFVKCRCAKSKKKYVPPEGIEPSSPRPKRGIVSVQLRGHIKILTQSQIKSN